MSGDLARRLVACRLFRWMPGMLTGPDDDGRCWRVVEGIGAPRVEQASGRRIRKIAPYVWPPPDLDDAATAGCLVELLNDRGPICVVNAGRTDGGWWTVTTGDLEWHSNSRGEAAARALIVLSEDS